jgi:hypothetical protein
MPIMTPTPADSAPSHDYHAQAQLLRGHLERPIDQAIEPVGAISLDGPMEGHFARRTENVSIEGFISFARGETRVSGARSLKDNGWVTLATSILEGLNVFEIITADRLVSQVSTNHPYKGGHFPRVTFVGTQFQNFQVGGFAPELKLNLGFCGDKPAGDRSYFQDTKFLRGVEEQTERIAGARGLPKELKDEYDEKLAYIKTLTGDGNAGEKGGHKPITCSLVQNINIGEIPIPGVQSFGNVLLIPEFGTVRLAEIEVAEKADSKTGRPDVYFTFTAAKMKLGCVADGTLYGATTVANGAHNP